MRGIREDSSWATPGFFDWIKGPSHDTKMGDFCRGLRVFGVDARVSKPRKYRAQVQGSPITGLRLEVQSDSYGTDNYIHYEVSDSRISEVFKFLNVRSKVIRSFPIFGEATDMIWRGDDLALGVIDTLRKNDGYRDQILNTRKNGDIHISASPDTWTWDLVHGEGLAVPNRELWSLYESVANNLLELPLPYAPLDTLKQTGITTQSGRPEEEGFDLQRTNITSVLGILSERSWLWWWHEKLGRYRALKRISSLLNLLNVIIAGLIQFRYVDSSTTPISLHVFGSYLWVTNPADIDLFLVVEGEHNLERYSSKDLAESGFQVPGIPYPPSLVIVGIDTLLMARAGRDIPHAKRLALMHTSLCGSVLLAGKDIFGSTTISRGEYEALRRDLLENGKRAIWPELEGDRVKIEAKKSWRKTEARALRNHYKGGGPRRWYETAPYVPHVS